MKLLVVLNGEYYAGENGEENNLMFVKERAKAVAVDDRRLRFIVGIIYKWFMGGEIELKRIEVLKVDKR